MKSESLAMDSQPIWHVSGAAARALMSLRGWATAAQPEQDTCTTSSSTRQDAFATSAQWQNAFALRGAGEPGQFKFYTAGRMRRPLPHSRTHAQQDHFRTEGRMRALTERPRRHSP